MLISSKKYLTKPSRIMFDQIFEYPGLSKLIHKINLNYSSILTTKLKLSRYNLSKDSNPSLLILNLSTFCVLFQMEKPLRANEEVWCLSSVHQFWIKCLLLPSNPVWSQQANVEEGREKATSREWKCVVFGSWSLILALVDDTHSWWVIINLVRKLNWD